MLPLGRDPPGGSGGTDTPGEGDDPTPSPQSGAARARREAVSQEADGPELPRLSSLAGRSRPALARTAESGVRMGVASILAHGVRRGNPSVAVNAAIGLGGTFLPEAVERRYGVRLHPWQRVYVETAMLTHATGMLGPYDEVWWWDHLTHTHSASILASVVIAASRREGRDPTVPVLASVVGLGALWELAEYLIHEFSPRFGLDPLLVSYGRDDVLLDICFDVIGGLLALQFAERALENVLEDEDERRGVDADPETALG